MSEDKKNIAKEPREDSAAENKKKPGASRGESRAVTSDSKNSASAYAGNTRINRKKAVSADTGSFDDDEILEIIRKRKSQKSAASSEHEKTGQERPVSKYNASKDEPDDKWTVIEEPEIDIPSAPDKAEKTTDISSHASEEPEKYDSSAEPEEKISAAANEPEEPAQDAPDDSDTAEEETDAVSAEISSDDDDILSQIPEVPDEDDDILSQIPEVSDEDEESSAEQEEGSGDHEDTGSDITEESSDLEKELEKDLSEIESNEKKAKRYGFKPYTRELQSEEIMHLQEAALAAEAAAGAAGINKKMTKKGNGQKNKKKGATGTSKTYKVSKSGKPAKSASSGTSKPKTQSTQKSKSQKSKSQKNKVPAVQTIYSKPPKKQKKWIGFLRAFVRTIIIFGLIAVLAGAGYAANIISHAPTIHPKNIYDTLDVSTHIYDDRERLVDEIYYSENRQIVSYEQLPENLKNAFIAVEDKTFWTHKGFNFKRIIGAILERFHGGRISGTSTITQQLARNIFLPEDKSVRSIKRKIIEMYYAYQIEQELSKEEILTAYLNTIYLGYGCYGVDTAAKTYFSSDVEDLTLEQCAALAALPQAPGTYSLLVTEPTDYTVEYKHGIYINDASQDRRNMILNMMLQQGLITEEEKEAAVKPLEDFIKPGSTATAASQSAFKDYLIETVKKDLMNEYGIEEDQAIKIIYTKGLNIYTTMDSQAQKAITKQFKDKDNFPSTTNGKGKVESAMVVCEVGTGEIKAMVGTRNAEGQMLFNRAVNPRQPGSSIKPLSVYAPALQKSYEYQKDGKTFKFTDTGYDKQGTSGWGNYITVSSKVIDEPMTINGKTWPQNVTRTYSGTNTFRTAIQKSINTCSVKILSQIGIEYSMDTLKRFGITTAIDDSSEPVNDLNLAALGLGAMSYGISPLEMAAAYATFPNGGVVNSPMIYTKVEDSSGRTLLEGRSETTKVLDEGVAWIMTDVLKSVVKNGIAYNAAVDGIEVGGKTGTTDDRFDIWFNGFTPRYSVALWIGTDDNVQMDSASEKAAALWSTVVSNMKRAGKGEYKSMPSNVYRAWDGDYYTNGTAPPEPEPEPEEEEEEDTKGKKGKKGKNKSKDSEKQSEDTELGALIFDFGD